ncbi:MAG: hypothetical protein IJO73_08450 [Clostridia bacterium]|nr:hypothetical protein [Clostridia bacterium]
MLRDYTEQIRYNERELSKSFSEKSLFGKIATVLSVLVLLFAIVFMIYMFEPKNTDDTNYTGELDLTVFESETTAVIE